MFNDKRFVAKVSVDKRGRPKNFATKENFEKFYDLQTSSDDDEEEVEEKGISKSRPEVKSKEKPEIEKRKTPSVSTSRKIKASKVVAEASDSEDDEHEVDEKILERLRSGEVDYARGEANLLSDSR
jgi:hypothetical protein